jgi:hypothetical protein
VAGKGVAAALIMSVVQASLRIFAAEENMSLGALAAKDEPVSASFHRFERLCDFLLRPDR